MAIANYYNSGAWSNVTEGAVATTRPPGENIEGQVITEPEAEPTTGEPDGETCGDSDDAEDVMPWTAMPEQPSAIAHAVGVASTVAVDAKDGEEKQTEIGLGRSEALFQQALLESKAEVPPLSSDGVVLLRLTRKACTPPVLEVLMRSPLLAGVRRRAAEAKCSVAPFGEKGPKFFVPWSDQTLKELADAGFKLEGYHILAHRSDKALIEQAFKASLSCQKRPKVTAAEHMRDRADHETEGGAEAGYHDLRDFSEPWVVEELTYKATAPS